MGNCRISQEDNELAQHNRGSVSNRIIILNRKRTAIKQRFDFSPIVKAINLQFLSIDSKQLLQLFYQKIYVIKGLKNRFKFCVDNFIFFTWRLSPYLISNDVVV